MKCTKCGYESEFRHACPCSWVVPEITGLFQYACIEDLPEGILHLIEQLKEYPVLTLKGAVGAGKTHAAVVMAKHWVHKKGRGKVGMYYGASLSRLPSSIDDYLGTIHNGDKAYSDKHIVILDDFVGGMAGPLEYRLNQSLPTLITTNENMDEMLGDRIISRLRPGVRVFGGTTDKRGDERFKKFRERRVKQHNEWRAWRKVTPITNAEMMRGMDSMIPIIAREEALRNARSAARKKAEGRG